MMPDTVQVPPAQAAAAEPIAFPHRRLLPKAIGLQISASLLLDFSQTKIFYIVRLPYSQERHLDCLMAEPN
jgi:hypothetical protein